MNFTIADFAKPDFQRLFKAVPLVIVYDDTGKSAPIYGFDLMLAMANGESKQGCQALKIKIDWDSDDLEFCIAVVETFKGPNSYDKFLAWHEQQKSSGFLNNVLSGFGLFDGKHTKSAIKGLFGRGTNQQK